MASRLTKAHIRTCPVSQSWTTAGMRPRSSNFRSFMAPSYSKVRARRPASGPCRPPENHDGPIVAGFGYNPHVRPTTAVVATAAATALFLLGTAAAQPDEEP